MQRILYPLREFADSFVDDCAVSSDTWNDHIVHLDSCLSTMQREGITLNVKKCQFASPWWLLDRDRTVAPISYNFEPG